MSGVELRPAVDDSDFQTTGGSRAFQASSFPTAALRVAHPPPSQQYSMPDMDGTFTAIRPEMLDIRDLRPRDFVSGEGDIGSIIKLDNGNEGVVLNKVGTELKVQEVHPGSAFAESGLGSSYLRTLVDQKGLEGKLAETVKRAKRGISEGASSAGQKAMDVKN